MARLIFQDYAFKHLKYEKEHDILTEFIWLSYDCPDIMPLRFSLQLALCLKNSYS
jgi:hypothetical protein